MLIKSACNVYSPKKEDEKDPNHEVKFCINIGKRRMDFVDFAAKSHLLKGPISFILKEYSLSIME